MRKASLFLLALMLGISLSVYAGTTGNLAGRVKNAEGEPVPFANILIKEGDATVTGTLTNEKGKYLVMNIEPGTYTVVCQAIGYHPYEVKNVVINVDETVTENMKLVSADVKIQGFQSVERKQKLIDANKTSTGFAINASTLEETPADDLEGLVALKPGVSISSGEMHVRGGRADEVSYTIDGLSVTDPVDRGAPLSVDFDAMENFQMHTGGFTAEYGNAQSAVVNIVTKSGGRNYSGKIEMNSNHIIGDGTNHDEIKFNFGGPVLGYMDSFRDKFTFFFNCSAAWSDGRNRDLRENNPYDDFITYDRQGNLKHLLYKELWDFDNDPYSGRDDIMGFDVGNRSYNSYTFNLKTRYKFSALQNLTLAIRGNRYHNNPFNYDWMYALQHYAVTEQEQRQYLLTYDLSPTTRTNLKVKLGYYMLKNEQSPNGIEESDYFADDPYGLFNPMLGAVNALGFRMLDMDGDGVTDYPLISGVDAVYAADEWSYEVAGDLVSIPGFRAPYSVFPYTTNDKTENIQFRSDFEYVYNDIHSFKTGLELQKHIINKDRYTTPWDIDPNTGMSEINSYLKRQFDANPSEIVNTYTIETGNNTQIYEIYEEGGVADSALTIINPDSTRTFVRFYKREKYREAAYAIGGSSDGYKAEPWQAAYYLQDKMDWEGMIVNLGLRMDLWYLGSSYDILEADGSYSEREFDKSDRTKIMLSPRLGISYPISERSVISFAYNYQNQLPQMQYVYTTYLPEDAAEEGAGTVIVGNPDLDPQITITYDVGYQQQLTEVFSMEVHTYFKNVYNYVSTFSQRLEGDESIKYYQYISQDYGSMKGIDFSLSKRMENYFGGALSYSFGWANGNHSSGVVQDENTSLREYPLDWDIRHSFSAELSFLVKEDEEFFIPGTDVELPLGARGAFSAGFTYTYNTGSPYTPQTSSGASLETNSERKPDTQNADLRFSKDIVMGGKSKFKVYFKVSNLFDKINIEDVYAKTGSYNDNGEDLEAAGRDFVYEETAFMHQQSISDPDMLSMGRRFTLGVAFTW